MLETKIYIRTKKRISEKYIEKIKSILELFKESLEITEIFFQQRVIIGGKKKE